MEWRKRNSRAIIKFSKWIPIVSLFVAHLPTNHIGQCAPLRNEFNFSTALKNESQRYFYVKPAIAEANRSELEYITDPEYRLVTGTHVVFEIISFIISTIILIIILAYLNNGVSVAKECIILYLYRDVVIIWMLLNSLWLIRMVLCYFTTRGLGIGELLAIVISFCTIVLRLSFQLIMNVIIIIKFYIAKKVMLDPPMPWADDESSGMKGIRLGCAVFCIFFTSTTYSLGYYPKFYYFFTLGPNSSLPIFRNEISIYSALFLLMTITYLLFFLAEQYYRSKNNQIAGTIIHRQMDRFVWMILLFVGIIYLLRITEFFSIFFYFKFTTRLDLYQGATSVMFLVVPVLFIVNARELKYYATRILKEGFYEAFLLNIYLTPALLMILINSTLCIFYQIFDL